MPRLLVLRECDLLDGRAFGRLISVCLDYASGGKDLKLLASIDLDAARQTILEGLPVRTRWLVGDQPLRYDFSQGRECLLPLNEVVEERWLVDAWRALLIFGSSDYADGGGATPWLTLDRTTGSVMGLDLERADEPVYLINSSLRQFVASFEYLERFLPAGLRLPEDAEDVVRALDDAAYPTSEWRLLLEYIR